MKGMVLSAGLVLVMTAFAAGPDWLAYVEYGPGEDMRSVAATGLTVVFELEQGCLVTASEAELAALSPTLGVRRLDTDPEQKHYVYVMTRRGPLPQLADFGVVLFEERWSEGAPLAAGAVLRTAVELPDGLDRLPAELAHIRLRPTYISDWPSRRSSEAVQGTGRADMPALPATSDSLVWNLVNAVAQDTVEAFIQRLQDFATRYSTTDSCRAAMQWVFDRLQAYGCDTVFEFPFRQGYAPNVIGIHYGKVNPQVIYGICAHTDATVFDSLGDPLVVAPGADDNASGTAALLEAARVFHDVEFENTLYFMAFSGEEQGLLGSDSLAEYVHLRGDSLVAVMNFDMISYGREGLDSLEIYGKDANPDCVWLVDFFIARADTFADLKIRRRIVNRMPWSDHESFWRRGIPALLAIEHDFTPEYHSPGDTIGPPYYRYCGTNNLSLATNTTRAAVAALARLAGAMPSGVEERPIPSPRPVRLVAVRPSVGPGGFRVVLSAPARSGSRLRVYSATGRLVRKLEITGRAEGYWDGRDETGRAASAGSYLFRLTDGHRATSLRAIITDRR